MLGKPLFSIEGTDLIKGMSTSDVIADGGFSSLSSPVQLTYLPGIVYQIAGSTDKSTNLVGTMIASCEDPTGSASRLYVSRDSTDDGRFYSVDSAGTLTLRGSEDTSHDYIFGRTDMIGFQGEAYVTTATYIVRWQQPATFDLTWHQFHDANAPHPALVYEGYAYYGDGDELWRQSVAGSVPTVILTLANSNEVMVSLGIDPGSGKMLISTVSQYNVSDTVNSVSKVLYYNGYSNKVDKTVVVDEMITAFYPVASEMRIGYGQNLGIWNGAGIQFLRKLNVALDNNRLPYKHHFSNIGSTMYLAENGKVLAYGPVIQGGPNVFYYCWESSALLASNNLTNIANIGNNLLTLCFISFVSADSFYTCDMSAIGTGGQDFYTNKYTFDRPYWIRRIRVVYKDTVAVSNSFPIASLYDESGLITSLGTNGVMALTNNTGAAERFHWIENINVKVNLLQIYLGIAIINPGIERIVVYADQADIG